jgi:hypothetical protein
MNLYDNEELIQWLGYEKKFILGCEANGTEWCGTKTGMGTYRNTEDIPELNAISNILECLQSHKFATWYRSNGNFGKWLLCEEDAPSDTELVKEIVQFFRI